MNPPLLTSASSSKVRTMRSGGSKSRQRLGVRSRSAAKLPLWNRPTVSRIMIGIALIPHRAAFYTAAFPIIHSGGLHESA